MGAFTAVSFYLFDVGYYNFALKLLIVALSVTLHDEPVIPDNQPHLVPAEPRKLTSIGWHSFSQNYKVGNYEKTLSSKDVEEGKEPDRISCPRGVL